MGEMAYKFFKDNLVKDRPEYPGTEFKFPILYGLTGANSASDEMIDGALDRVKQEKGGHFLDALWLAEQVESGYDDHEEHFISDDRFRSSCLGLNSGTNAWALLMGGDDKLVDLVGLLRQRISRYTRRVGPVPSFLRSSTLTMETGPRESCILVN